MIPSLDLLLDVSIKTLEDIELASRNQSANISKTIRRELEAWIELEATAMVARWFIEHRNAPQGAEPKKVEFLSQSKKSA